MRTAIIPTTGRDTLWACLAAVEPQVDYVVIIAHRCNSIVWDGLHGGSRKPVKVLVQDYDREVPNISTMWNLGLDKADEIARKVASMDDGIRTYVVLNDDAILPYGWVTDMQKAMSQTGAAAASRPEIEVPTLINMTAIGPESYRMAGYAFALDGQRGLRIDEQFEWWFSDNDIEWQARLSGGCALVPGVPVTHLHPNESTTGVLAEKASADRIRFEAKWGVLP